MAIYPATGTTLTRDGNNFTGVGLSTSILVKVGALTVGGIQTLSVTEARQIAMVNEVGTDGSVDSAPQSSTAISGQGTRIRLDRLRITEAFGRDFLHILSQRIPFDIDIFDQWSGDGANTIITTLKNVWINNSTYNYSATDWIVSETFSFQAESISSTLNGGPAATGGLRGSSILQLNSVERDADRGLRRGSMDAPGLINDFFTAV